MPNPVIVAGTGTDVGKTVFSSLVMGRYAAELGLKYLKPVQTGTPTDTESVRQNTGLGSEYFIKEIHRFTLPASPHWAAEMDANQLDWAGLVETLKSYSGKSVIIELAGGLMVPLVRYKTNLELIQELNFPVIMVASTALGTINHSVLSLKALQNCAGIFFVGPQNDLFPDNARTIHEMTDVKILGHKFLEGSLSADGFDAQGHVREVFA